MMIFNADLFLDIHLCNLTNKKRNRKKEYCYEGCFLGEK